MVKLNIEIPEKFFEGETRDGHYITPEMKKIWAVMFDLLFEFKRVCDKYNLRWWADAGTLLGAVRHKGIIPWDDDMDVIMMREDYEKLCEIAPTEFKHPYFLQTDKTYTGYVSGFAKLRNSEATNFLTNQQGVCYDLYNGLFIDIFPLDTILNDEKLWQKQLKSFRKYQKRILILQEITSDYNRNIEKNIYKRIRDRIWRFITNSSLKKISDIYMSHKYKKLRKIFTTYTCHKSDLICKTVMGMESRRIWQKSWFDETVYLPFEWFEVPAPKEYTQLLDKFYGNWHEFIKRDYGHVNAEFNSDISYTNQNLK